MDERKPVYMKCGHNTTARMYPEDIPICTTCLCHEPAEKPDLSGRSAHCSLCENTKPSSFNLPFFRYRDGKPYDTFYDGCMGWD